MMDRSHGYEDVAAEFLARRGSGRSTGVGVNAVRKWARTLPRGAAEIDLGCGPGFPMTEVLVAEGLNVFGVDAAPSFVQAFRRNLPNTPVVCEALQDSRFFDRTFDGVLAWGLMFLLCPEDQRRLIPRIADLMVPGGRLLFTSPAEPLLWNDAMTGLESRSLGAEEYRKQLAAVGLSIFLVSTRMKAKTTISMLFSKGGLRNPGRPRMIRSDDPVIEALKTPSMSDSDSEKESTSDKEMFGLRTGRWRRWRRVPAGRSN